MDPETLRRLARELYRAAARQARDGTPDGQLISGYLSGVAADYHARAIRIDQSQARAEAVLRETTVELPIVAPRPGGSFTVREVNGVRIEYRADATIEYRADTTRAGE